MQAVAGVGDVVSRRDATQEILHAAGLGALVSVEAVSGGMHSPFLVLGMCAWSSMASWWGRAHGCAVVLVCLELTLPWRRRPLGP
jgi:hypothetical protein